MKKCILALGLISFCNFSYSAGSYSGKVKDVRVDRDGRGIIAFEGQIGNQPAACRSEPYTAHMSFDAKTEGGKAIYSMALAALASGKSVSANGTGTCLEYNGIVESLSYWHILRN